MSLEKELEKELREDSKLEKVASLIESGVNVNHKLEATTFLNLAVIQNRLELVQILVEAGADVNSPKSPLAVAAHHGFQEIFEFLAPLTNPRERRRSTIDLPEGIRHRAKVEEWLNDFTQVGTKRHLQDTLASISAEKDVNAINSNGCTVLWTAAHNGYVESLQVLIEAGADVNIRNRTDGWSPLLIAAATHEAWTFGTQKFWGVNKSRQLEVVQLLLSAGADVNLSSNNNQTPLMEASACGAIDMVDILLKANADVNLRDNNGRSAIDLAQKFGHDGVVQRIQN